MFRTILLTGILLGAAAIGPAIFFSAPDYWAAVKQEWIPGEKPPVAADPNHGEAAGLEIRRRKPGELPPEGLPIRDLSEVFNFNVTTDWIAQRWPRVTTGLARLQLQGYRVPLVTGTGRTDLAGSLTYYFNSQGQVQTITFRGTTGDARVLVRLLTSRHRFVHRTANDAGLFLYEATGASNKVTGVTRIRPARVINFNEPNTRYEVELIIERPTEDLGFQI